MPVEYLRGVGIKLDLFVRIHLDECTREFSWSEGIQPGYKSESNKCILKKNIRTPTRMTLVKVVLNYTTFLV